MIQTFAQSSFASGFVNGKMPRLLCASKMDSQNTVYPRVLHKHDVHCEIMYVMSGQGRYVIDEICYPIKADDVIICNAGTLHDEIPESSMNLNRFCISLTDVQLQGLPENHILDTRTISPVFPAGNYAETISFLVKTIYSDLVADPVLFAETCQYLSAALICNVLLCAREYTGRGTGQDENRNNIIATQAREYINVHYNEEFSLQDIADQLHVSPYHLSHVFKNVTGFSPKQYALRRRLGEAQTLLITTKMTLTDISMQVGFNNPAYFNTAFKKHIGMSPGQYRQNYLN